MQQWNAAEMWLLAWCVYPAAALKEPDTSLHLTLADSLAIKILEGKPPDFLGKENYFATVIKIFQLFQNPTAFQLKAG